MFGSINLPFLLCFTSYLRAIFQVHSQAPCGLTVHVYLEGPFIGACFLRYHFGGLYLEGLVHGEAHFGNFTVCCTLHVVSHFD